MKTTKRLNIEDKPGYLFVNMTNINDFDVKLIFIDEFTILDQSFFILIIVKKIIYHMLFLIM